MDADLVKSRLGAGAEGLGATVNGPPNSGPFSRRLRRRGVARASPSARAGLTTPPMRNYLQDEITKPAKEPGLPDRLEEIVDVLRSRILRGLESGALAAGDRLPSGRDLAAEFEIDHRTILAAYRILADERLIDMRPRGGVYVADRHGSHGIPPVPESWLVDVLTDGLAREIPAPELPEWLRRCTETLRLRAVIIASTSDQCQGLCRELADDFGLEVEGLLASELTGERMPLPLKRADLIVTTAAHAERMHALGADLKKPVQVIDVRPDLVAGEWAMLLRRPVYVVVATAEFGDMIRAFFANVAGAGNLNIVVLGRDDVSSIPAAAPTYITQSARASLGGVRIPGRILPAARTISTRSARQIFGFIVSSNVEAMSRLAP